MNNLSTFPVNTVQQEPQARSPLTKQYQKNKSVKGLAQLLQLWYRITSPPEPSKLASFEERELFRRARTGSQISIFLFILVLISYPAAFIGSANPLLVVILTVDLCILLLAMA